MQIKHNNALPGICGSFTQGELSDKEPFIFRACGFMQYLTEPEWKALQKYAVKEKETAKSAKKEDQSASKAEEEPQECEKQTVSGLELLRAKYAALKSKNSAEGVKLRAEIKKLEAAEGK